MIGAIIAKKRARSVLDTLSRHDIDAFMAGLAEDCTFIFPGNLSVSGEIKGKEAVQEWYQNFFDRFPVTSFTLKNACVENIFALVGTNVLSIEWDLTIHDQQGEQFEISGVNIVHLKGGKAVLVVKYISDLEMVKKALGEA